MKRFIILSVVTFGLFGCGQVYDKGPVGVGYDNDELKLSPCACMQIYRG